MKGWVKLLSVGLVLCGVSGVQGQQIQVSGANRTIAVTTSEDAERRADTATVHIGYQLYAATSQGVTQEAAATSKAIADALAKAGVPGDAVESEGQGTGPVQEYQGNGVSPEERAGRRFQAQQSWTVRAGAEAASKVLAAAVGAGANQSGAIDWSVADESSLSAEAAGKALKHAEAIAEQMALGLGAKLGQLVYASNEAQSLAVRPLNARGAGFSSGTSAGSMVQNKLSLSVPMVRRSATVSAVFALQ